MIEIACTDTNRGVDAHAGSTAFHPAWLEEPSIPEGFVTSRRLREERRICAVKALATRFKLRCSLCGAVYEDDGLQLECSEAHSPSLLVSDYEQKEFTPADDEEGLYRYRHWLPTRRTLRGSGRTVTYRSESLSKITGLRNLWIAFNGYWPERSAALRTGTFKELEAYAVLSRIPHESDNVLVVASAGNTAAAFARACTVNHIRCLIVMPESGLAEMRLDVSISPGVKIVSLGGNSDYSDAIRFAETLACQPGFVLEGGAKNVARRDGLGTVLLNAFETIGSMPEYYFQAIGSGAGAIAVHEAACRLTNGRGPFPRLWLSQNEPFVPIADAWRKGSRAWTPIDERQAKRQIAALDAKVLSNRFPPYAIPGGLYDALVESDGIVVSATNSRALAAAELFEASEGIDIHPAAAVAFASLLTASSNGFPSPNATVVLNISGGGKRRLANDVPLFPKPPDLTLHSPCAARHDQLDQIGALFE
jgi:cysteate synthase